MIAIRLADEADAWQLIAIDTFARDHPERGDAIRNWIRRGECHLAILEETMAGYVVLNRSFLDRPFVELLMVGAAARRHGVGTRLLHHACALFPAEKLWTSTNHSNLAMRELLAKACFEESGIIHGLDADDPELVFSRPPPVPTSRVVAGS